MQQAPWQRAIFVTYAEEAPERHYRISDLPAPLVDHYALDRPQLFSVAATNRCAFDLVARDQIGGFACLHCRSMAVAMATSFQRLMLQKPSRRARVPGSRIILCR